MKRIFHIWLLSIAILVTSTAFANKVAPFPTSEDSKRVLECLVTFGEFQAVSVFSMSDGTFRMTTLNNTGSRHAYEMPSNQWSVGKLDVPCSRDANQTCGTLYVQDRDWSYDFGSSIGDCR